MVKLFAPAATTAAGIAFGTRAFAQRLALLLAPAELRAECPGATFVPLSADACGIDNNVISVRDEDNVLRIVFGQASAAPIKVRVLNCATY
jgi:hypothetical protein